MSGPLHAVLRVVAGVAGAVVVGAVCLSAIRTVVVPRSSSQRLTLGMPKPS
jgi:hypothetical protein